MNRKMRNWISAIRGALDEMELLLDNDGKLEFPEEEPSEEFIVTHMEKEMTNWSAADEPAKDTVYLKDLKELTELKGIVITGQITSVFDLKPYIKKDGTPGMLYRVVLTDETGGVTLISFDDMATKLKQYPIGTYLRITNAWKMKENKHKIKELHVGNFAKIEVVE